VAAVPHKNAGFYSGLRNQNIRLPQYWLSLRRPRRGRYLIRAGLYERETFRELP
jgi:hypothetical protein